MSGSDAAFVDGSGGGGDGEAPKGFRHSALRREGSVALRLSLRRELEGLRRRLSARNGVGEARPSDAAGDGPRGADEGDESMSSLKETICRNEETMVQLQRQLSDMESQKKSAERALFDMKTTYKKMKKTNFHLIKRMAEKASEQLRSKDESKRTEVDDWKGNYSEMECLYDVLVEKVEQIADENGELTARIQTLEEEGRRDKEELAAMAGTQEECDVLRQSLEGAVEMATGMGDALERTERDRRARVNGYEQQLAVLNTKLVQATFQQTQSDLALEKLSEENDLLRTQFADAERYYKENLAKVTKGEKDGRRKKLSAYINKLRGGPGQNEGGES